MDYDRLIHKHKNAIYRQMLRACGNREDAEDVLVEAMLAAYRALPTIRNEESFRGWLGVVGQRICKRIKREEALRPILSLSDGLDVAADFDVEETAEARRFVQGVESAVASLEPGLREVYEMRELQDLSSEETADQLKLSQAAVKSRLHRARAKVRFHMDALMGPVGP